MKDVNELKAGALLSYVNLGISTVIPLFYTPVMLRLLGQAEYGLYSLSNSVISYLSLLTFGLGSTILRYLTQARTENNREKLESTLGLFAVLYSIISLITLIVGIILTRFSGSIFAKGLTILEIHRLNILIVLMALNSAISLICVPFASISICYEKYIFRKIVEMISTIAVPLLNVAVLYAGYASIGMAIIGTIMQILLLILYVWFCICRIGICPKFKNLPLGMLKDIFGFTAFIFLSSIADLLYWSTDKVLLGAMVSSSAVAIYNVGATFNSMLQNLSSSISSVFAPRVNQFVFSGHRIEDFSELLIRVGRIQYLIVSLVLSGFIVFGRTVIRLWAGAEYEDAYVVALLTMVPLAVPLIQNIAFTTITAQNRHRFRSILYVVLAVLNVIGTYYLIPLLGIIGAALCTCVVFALGHGIVMNWFYYKKIGLNIPVFWRNILKMTIVPAFMIATCSVLQHFGLQVYTLMQLLGWICVYTVFFSLFSWQFTMNSYEKSLISGLFKKVVHRRN